MIDDAQELATELSTILPDAFVTLDPRAAYNALDRGEVVLIVNPPKLTQLTTTETREDFTVTVAAGPAEDMVSAWGKLSPPVHALLLDDNGFTEADPAVFRTPGGKDFPAYTLTIEL